jgi:nucleotide-binding universal stress UspA family protein
MIALKKILVPTDFSKGSENALRYGCELAAKFGGELHLLHIMQETVGDFDYFYAVSGNFFEEMREDAQRRMDAVLDPAWNGGKGVKRVVTSGTPFREILRYAKQNEIDLIVMGTHGRGAITHMLMGSVAEKVVRMAACPVLTVRHPEHEFLSDESVATRSEDAVTI